jgi:hypothetical protein
MSPAAVVQDSALHKVTAGHHPTVAMGDEPPMNPAKMAQSM